MKLKLLIWTFVWIFVFCSSSKALSSGFLTLPTEKNFTISCGFGCYAGHNGTDYPTPLDSIVVAAADGVATAVDQGNNDANCNGFGTFGKMVTITHSNGYVTKYAHLNSFVSGITAGGQSVEVRRGQIIGYSGTSGGPWEQADGQCRNAYHLHFEVKDPNGIFVNPYDTAKWLWLTNPPTHGIFNDQPKSFPTFNPQTASIYQSGDGTLTVIDQDRVAHGVLDTNPFLQFLSTRTCKPLAIMDFRPFNSNGVNVTNTSGANMFYDEIIRRGYIQSSGIFYTKEENANALVYIPLRGYYLRSGIESWISEQAALLPKMDTKDRAYAEAEIDIAKIVLGIQQLTAQTCANQPPKITLLGANPMKIQKGDVFRDPGFTAMDQENGNIFSSAIVSGDTVNTSMSGTYIRKYDVTDPQGASATQMIRVIHVVENGMNEMNTPFITVSDINGNGYSEIVVMTIDPATSRPVLIIKDMFTGNEINRIFF